MCVCVCVYEKVDSSAELCQTRNLLLLLIKATLSTHSAVKATTVREEHALRNTFFFFRGYTGKDSLVRDCCVYISYTMNRKSIAARTPGRRRTLERLS